MKRVMLSLNLLCISAFAFGLYANSEFRDVINRSRGRIEQRLIEAGGRDHPKDDVADLERQLASVNQQLGIANKGRCYILIGIFIVGLGMAFAKKPGRREDKMTEPAHTTAGNTPA